MLFILTHNVISTLLQRITHRTFDSCTYKNIIYHLISTRLLLFHPRHYNIKLYFKINNKITLQLFENCDAFIVFCVLGFAGSLIALCDVFYSTGNILESVMYRGFFVSTFSWNSMFLVAIIFPIVCSILFILFGSTEQQCLVHRNAL